MRLSFDDARSGQFVGRQRNSAQPVERGIKRGSLYVYSTGLGLAKIKHDVIREFIRCRTVCFELQVRVTIGMTSVSV